MAVTVGDIRAASERIRPVAKRTPVMTSRSFDRAAGVEAYFKCENFQTGGAFKIRGAMNFVFSLAPDVRAKGVVAFSSGNHAQAVAIAARHAGIRATLVMPHDAPKSKLKATRDAGGEVIAYDRYTEDREAIGRRIASETGATLIPPFDHEWIVAGQGTAGLELMEQAPGLDTLVVCLGGGGLTSGCALAAKAANPSIRVFGVEPEAGNDYWLSRRKGERVEIPVPKTLADGLMTTKPGAVTWPLIEELVEDILLVNDAELLATMKLMLARMKILAEPSGAAAAAAVLHGKLPAGCRRVGILVSGGNVDLDLLARLG
ncbi:MAG: pyridoxal-phosphate dependent enzyme [Bryobacteraceae bacterium]|nr:pyridoxal-phosphate dependent enzyme [Bryobacteraceae bacterium]